MNSLFMQQFAFGWGPTVYFAIGDPQKTSFATQFCRENNYVHMSNPSVDQVKSEGSHSIVEGSLDLFNDLEKCLPELSLIFLGTD